MFHKLSFLQAIIFYRPAMVFCLVFIIPTALNAQPPIRFDAPRAYLTGTLPTQVIPIDLDGDGDLDAAVLLAGNTSEYRLQFLENPGDGTLAVHSSMIIPSGGELVSGNLDGSGLVDLVQVKQGEPAGGELVVLLSNGPFSFTVNTQTLSFIPLKAATGNINGGNVPDIVVGDATLPEIHLFRNNGTGSFTLQDTFDSESLDGQGDFKTRDLACNDLDGDGDDDVIVVNSMIRDRPKPYRTHSIVRLMNQGNGNLAPFRAILDGYGAEIDMQDMDGDGDVDILTSGVSLTETVLADVIVLKNNGDGSFQAPLRFSAGGGIYEIGGATLGDADGDGDFDAAIMLYGPLMGNPNDCPTDRWALLRNNGSGNLALPEIYPTGADIKDLVFADLDGSGNPEVLTVAADDDYLAVHYNVAGAYPAPPILSVDDPRYPQFGNPPIDIANGDIDNDGLIDLQIITDVSRFLQDGPDTLVLFAGINGGISATPSIRDIQEGPTRLLVEQITNNPAADISVIFLGYEPTDDPMGLGLSLGLYGAPPAAMQLLGLNGAPSDLTALDVNSDGINDIAVLRLREEGITAGISIIAVNSQGSMTPAAEIILGSDDVMAADTRIPYVITSADMNADGRRDIVAVTRNALGTKNGIVTVLLNNGNLSFTSTGEFMTVTRTVSDIIAADVNGDGMADVLLTTVASATDENKNGTLEILFNQGGGTLSAGISYQVGQAPIRIAVAPMDDSAGLDIAVADDGSNDVCLLFNDGSGRFILQERYVTGGGTDGITAADLDQDGDIDIAVCNHEALSSNDHGTMSILYNRTTGGSTPLPPAPTPAAPTTADGGGGCFISIGFSD